MFSCSSSSVIHSPCLIGLVGTIESARGEETVGLTTVAQTSDVAQSPDTSLQINVILDIMKLFSLTLQKTHTCSIGLA